MDITKLSLAQRDKILKKIEDEILFRKTLILEKNRKIDKKKKVNHFLEDVKGDYEKYYNYILNEKKQQYNSMMLIKNYLDDLIKKEKNANLQLQNIRQDQHYILNEMDKIKIELDNLI